MDDIKILKGNIIYTKAGKALYNSIQSERISNFWEGLILPYWNSMKDTSEPKEDTAKADGSGFTYILMGIAAVAVIGVVYVVKSKKKRENFIDEDEDEDELDEDYDYEDEEENEQSSDESFLNGGDDTVNDTESESTTEHDNDDEENGEE